MIRMTAAIGDDVFQRIKALLEAAEVSFVVRDHVPTFTSEESAAARGEELGTGAKALLVKCNSDFRLFVLPADRKLDSKAVKRHLNIRKMRFASSTELLELTGLVPGAVPPFGRPVLNFPLCIDEGMRENSRVAFNAGMLTRSITMSGSDYIRVAEGQLGRFSQP